MSWSKLNDEEPELYYNSKAMDYFEISSDISLVYQKMKSSRENDNALFAKELIFIVNATNGYVRIMWYDSASQKGQGTWAYQLNLKNFWNSDLKQGAFTFDKECHLGICCFTESILPENTDVYTKYETGAIEKLLV